MKGDYEGQMVFGDFEAKVSRNLFKDCIGYYKINK